MWNGRSFLFQTMVSLGSARRFEAVCDACETCSGPLITFESPTSTTWAVYEGVPAMALATQPFQRSQLSASSTSMISYGGAACAVVLAGAAVVVAPPNL